MSATGSRQLPRKRSEKAAAPTIAINPSATGTARDMNCPHRISDNAADVTLFAISRDRLEMSRKSDESRPRLLSIVHQASGKDLLTHDPVPEHSRRAHSRYV